MKQLEAEQGTGITQTPCHAAEKEKWQRQEYAPKLRELSVAVGQKTWVAYYTCSSTSVQKMGSYAKKNPQSHQLCPASVQGALGTSCITRA